MTQTQARMVELHTKQYLEGPPLTLLSIKTQVGTSHFTVPSCILYFFKCLLFKKLNNFLLQYHSEIAITLLLLFMVYNAVQPCLALFVVGVISLSRSVYGKANSVIPLVISAQDGGGLVTLVSARVNISVVAGLVAPPVFEQTQYYCTVSEDVLRGTVVGIVQASSKIGGDDQHMPFTLLCHSLTD